MRSLTYKVALAAIVSICTVANNASAVELQPPGADPAAVKIVYDARDGSLGVVSPSELTSISIRSAGSMLIPEAAPADEFMGLFDILEDNQFFKLSPDPNQFASLDLGMSLPSGLTIESLLADLDVKGSVYPEGRVEELGNGPVLAYVPEPSSVLLTICGVLGLLGLRRRK